MPTEHGFRLRPCDEKSASALGAEVGLGATVAQVLLHRGHVDAASARAFLAPSLADLTDPGPMRHRELAAELIAATVRAKRRIVVFGDYDADGTTSAVLLSEVLAALGADVVPLLANRFEGGYGLSMPALERCLALDPALLVTCDCGSSDHERIAEAGRRGVTVVVIDHHLVPSEPLPADAFLNPHHPECTFGYKGLASAGLAFSVAAAVRAKLDPKFDMRPYLDLVAVGTVADVAPLDGDNRKLVHAGLGRISSGACRPGIAAMWEARGGRRESRIGGRDVSFGLAPRINAPGRLGDAHVALELLRARNAVDARALASAVERANDERKRIEKLGTATAIAQVEAYAGPRPTFPVLASDDSLHRGVVGISAARVAERFRVPAAVVAVDGALGHASVRSYGGADVYAMLERVSPLLEAFGGHAAAAGFTVRRERIEELRDALREVVVETRRTDARMEVDLTLGGAFGIPRASELVRLEPVGERNAAPRVLVAARVLEQRAVGAQGSRKLELAFGSERLSAFVGPSAKVERELAGEVSVIGTLSPDGYRGREAVQIEVELVC